MDLFIQIGMIIITIAFIILMYSIVQTLKVLKAAIEEMRLMIGQVRTDVSHISEDMKEAIHNTNEMTLDVRKKLSSLNILFATVNDIGQAVHSFTGIAKESAANLATTLKKDQRQTIQSDRVPEKQSDGISNAIIDTIISSLRIWKRVKKY